jgi:prevent-host-death family protein
MSANTVIAASEAKAKFSELLDSVQSGESFSITLHGQEAAKLVPARRPNLLEVQEVIARMKASRSVLNPPGKPKLKLTDLINEGRP